MPENIKEAQSGERNHGIDLLRLVTMLFICILHVCNKGGVVSHLTLAAQPHQYRAAWLLEAITFGSVDIFSMISGFVGYKKKFRLSRPLYIWLELVFYMLAGALLMTFLCPELMRDNAWFRAVTPVLHGEYWYMTAYFGMVLLSPVLNAAARNMSVRSLGLTLFGIFTFCSVLPTVMDVSVFGLSSGYSTLWLCMMYLFGAFLEKIRRPRPVVSFAAFVLLTAVTWLFRINGFGTMLKYTSPTVILAAAALTMAFSELKIKGKAAKAVIGFAAPSALGIFIIHVHDVVWEFVLKDAAVPFTSDPAALMCGKILLSALVMFLLCFAVDVARRGVFWLLHVKPLLKKTDRALDALVNKKTADRAEGENNV